LTSANWGNAEAMAPRVLATAVSTKCTMEPTSLAAGSCAIACSIMMTLEADGAEVVALLAAAAHELQANAALASIGVALRAGSPAQQRPSPTTAGAAALRALEDAADPLVIAVGRRAALIAASYGPMRNGDEQRSDSDEERTIERVLKESPPFILSPHRLLLCVLILLGAAPRCSASGSPFAGMQCAMCLDVI
jgi:hypothetical protein